MKGLISSVKQFLRNCFFNHLSVKFHITNAVITLAVLISVSSLFLEFIIRSGEIHTLNTKINQVIVTLFTIEYILRLLVAPKIWRYVFSWQGFIDLVAIAPFYLYTVGVFKSFSLLLLARSLRFLKFLQVD
jgi:voltage-gated potassium channel